MVGVECPGSSGPVAPTTAWEGKQAVLAAARQACAGQALRHGALHVVATPIGNLADISLRALDVLQRMDVLACEDTRHTRALLDAYGVAHPAAWIAVHEHNENEAAQGVLRLLAAGKNVAFVSDAGTPAVSDPGARLVAAVRQAGHSVVPIPGASSVTTLLSVAGIVGGGSFVFMGFLPTAQGERSAALDVLRREHRAVVLLEAPHRIRPLAQALGVLGDRIITVGRELTKRFEDIATLPAQELAGWLDSASHRCKGEFALVLHPIAQPAQVEDASPLLTTLLRHVPLKTAVHIAQELTGHPHRSLYAQALALRAVPEPPKFPRGNRASILSSASDHANDQ